jgi:hypothetical protein
MAQAVRQSSSLYEMLGATNTVTISLPNVLAASDVVVQCLYSNFLPTTATLTVNDGNAYTKEVGVNTGASSDTLVAIYRLRNVSSGSKSIVVTGNGTNANSYGQFMASEVTGDANVAVDKTSTNTTGTIVATTSGTLSQANEIVFVVAGADGSQNWTGGTYSNPPTGFTNLSSNTSSGHGPYAFVYQVVNATTALAPSWGAPTNTGNVGIVLATFEGSASVVNFRKTLSGIGGKTGQRQVQG